MSWFLEHIPYALAIGTLVLGALEIQKDWGDYKNSKTRITVSAIFIFVAVLSIVGLYNDSKDKKKAGVDIETLKTAAKTANDAQERNTKLYVDSFQKMSEQISDLKTQAKTEALQKKLDSVQAELQKSMAPTPKAELSFTFVPYHSPPFPQTPTPVRDVTLPLQSNGSIRVEFSILNLTKVDAIEAEADFYICDLCKYTKEPPLFIKVSNLKETVRLLVLNDLHAIEGTQAVSLDILPPPSTNSIIIGFVYRCRTCSLHINMTPEATGTIHIERPQAKGGGPD